MAARRVIAPTDTYPSDAYKLPFRLQDLPMDQLIGTLLQRILYRVLVADYNLKIFLRAKVDSLRLLSLFVPIRT